MFFCYGKLVIMNSNETFENYFKRLKLRRSEDGYRYTDDDFEKYQKYIQDCWISNLSVYKCLEFMSLVDEL